MARTRVVVTGLGCVSPLGLTVEDTWRSILKGESGVGPITLFDTTDFKTRIAAEVKGFDPDAALGRRQARRMDRFTQFAIAAEITAVSITQTIGKPEAGIVAGSCVFAARVSQAHDHFDRHTDSSGGKRGLRELPARARYQPSRAGGVSTPPLRSPPPPWLCHGSPRAPPAR